MFTTKGGEHTSVDAKKIVQKGEGVEVHVTGLSAAVKSYDDERRHVRKTFSKEHYKLYDLDHRGSKRQKYRE